MALAFDVNILVVEAVDRTALEDPRTEFAFGDSPLGTLSRVG
jgi:hypothetical protein